MSKEKCGFMKCNGHDVICTLHNVVLADIMGYDGRKCNECVNNFTKMLCNRIANAMFGRHITTNPIYVDTDALRIEKLPDCDYCRNAHTCGELSDDNDLSYITLAYDSTNLSRVVFRSGNKQATVILVEENTKQGWKPTFCLVPRYCPNCGRELFENRKYLEKGKSKND